MSEIISELTHPFQNDPEYKRRKSSTPKGDPTGLILWNDFEVHAYRNMFFIKRWLVDYVECQSTEVTVRTAYGREDMISSTTWVVKTWIGFKTEGEAIRFIKTKGWKE